MTNKPITKPKAGKPKATKPTKKQADNSPVLDLATIRAILDKPAPKTYDPTEEIREVLLSVPSFYTNKGQPNEVIDYDGMARAIFSLKGLSEKLLKECTNTPAQTNTERFCNHVQKYLSAINDDSPIIADFDELSGNMMDNLHAISIIWILLGALTWNA